MITSKKILVIDDEVSIRRFLKVSLENEGVQYVEATNGRDGIRQVIAAKPDMIILDLGLPDMDGIEVIHAIREWSKIPILVLTVRDDEDSKVRILDAGADDYLTKPFSIQELLARIRVAERHAQHFDQNQPVFTTGALKVDLTSRQIWMNDQEVRLTPTEYDILKLLIRYAGKVVTHRQMLKEIWGPNSVEHTQYLRVYVGHLRKKLMCEAQPELIQTEPGVGYRLII